MGSVNYDVIFTKNGVTGCPGGGCLNVAMNLRYLRADFEFHTFLSDDRLGRIVEACLRRFGIPCSIEPCARTNLALGFSDSLTTQYTFFKQEMRFTAPEATSHVVYASGTQFLSDSNASALCACGSRLIYDLNLRASLSPIEAANLHRIARCAAVIKYSDEDIEFLGEPLQARISFCTFRDGCLVTLDEEQRRIYSKVNEQPVSVVGAGDAFGAMLAYQIARTGIENLTINALAEIGRCCCEFAGKKVGLCASWVE